MAKDKSEKKEKKEKRSEVDGVSKKDKKEKKEKKVKSEDITTAPSNQLEPDKPGSVAIDADGDVVIADVQENGVMEEQEEKKKLAIAVPKGALVPFANPLADEKVTKKALKGVRRAAKHKTLKRGVKEVVKSLRKSPTSAPPSSNTSYPPGVVILAADISPMDVISHIPVLCEDHNIPYLYVTSRAELGAAGNTKRPTSVVMIARDRGTKKANEEGGEDDQEYGEVFSDLVKVVQKAARGVKV